MENNSKSNFFTFALNPYVTINRVENVEKKVNNADYLIWGNDNQYPFYLFGLYENCATLQSIINGTADFICGDEIVGKHMIVNKKGETVEDIVRRVVSDILIYGGFAIQVIKNPFNQVIEIYWLDFGKLRTDEKNEVIFYSDDWSKSFGRVKCVKYPVFRPEDENPTSVFYFKGDKTRGTYPIPIYNAAIDSCEIERKITEFHLNEISNNFLSSKIINFNSGTPDEEMKNEIERNLTEKFGGGQNAGRFLVAFNENKDSAVTIENLGEDGFADRYNALAKRVGTQIFTAFRATPMLFGVPQENSGFNIAEYEESFKLYNRTVVRPIQKRIVDAFDKIYGEKDSITIKPFSLENKYEKIVD